MTVERFEDLLAWQRARDLASDAYAASTSGTFARDWGLKDQLNRAAAPVAANIAEGFERGSRAEFAQFLVLANGSAGEVRSHLYIACDRRHLDFELDGKRLLAAAEEVSRLVSALLASVRRQRTADRLKGASNPA